MRGGQEQEFAGNKASHEFVVHGNIRSKQRDLSESQRRQENEEREHDLRNKDEVNELVAVGKKKEKKNVKKKINREYSFRFFFPFFSFWFSHTLL